jgi:serine/threonine-protein kinase
VILCNRGGLYDVAKLLDFGLVHLPATGGDNQRLTSPGLIFGTPAYLSPEQAKASPELDCRSDIYSMGALAYFLLTGSPPFVRQSVVQTLAAHISEPFTPSAQFLKTVPADLQAIVQRCLAKDPAERFADARSLDCALAASPAIASWTAEQAAAWWKTTEGLAETSHEVLT